jgi:iron complex transport system substrate-binding protein
MSELIRDAGGVILGSKEGRSESSLMSVEQAFALSCEADCWLNVGWADNLSQLRDLNPLFGDFPVIGRKVYNNTLRRTPEGGNDFWESGSSRPDLILEDLIRILHPSVLEEGQLEYYVEVKD